MECIGIDSSTSPSEPLGRKATVRSHTIEGLPENVIQTDSEVTAVCSPASDSTGFPASGKYLRKARHGMASFFYGYVKAKFRWGV